MAPPGSPLMWLSRADGEVVPGVRLAFCCAPGISSAKTSTLLPPIGSFSICALPTVVEIVVDDVSITVRASLDLSRLPVTPATSAWMGRCVARAVSTLMFSMTIGWKPLAMAVNV